MAQASLTGESLLVEKWRAAATRSRATRLSAIPLCFMGTNVVSGTAQAMVFATGGNTGLVSWPGG